VALSKVAITGSQALKAGAGLIPESVRIGVGRSSVAEDKGDRRFADPTWTDNPATAG